MSPEEESTATFFKSIPNCATLLSQPNIKILPFGDGLIHDPFFRKTARNNDGVLRSMFIFQRHSAASFPESESKSSPSTSTAPFPEGHLLVQIGRGICGQENIAHGGFLATVMDEVSGTLISAAKLDEGLGMFTVALNTSYQRPVFSPGIIVASSRVAKVEGRKVFIESVIRDQSGNVCTTAEAIFVKKRPAEV